MDDSEALEAIRTACDQIGTTPPPPASIIFDGAIHRYHCPINDKPGECNAWVKCCNNGDSFGGTCGHWRTGIKRNWSSRSRKEFTPGEKRAYAERMASQREKELAEREQRHAAARTKAAEIWRRSKPASPDHPYLLKKSIAPHRAKQSGNFLVLDYRSADGTMTTLQFIGGDGEKRFLSGGEVAGSSHRFGGHPVCNSLILAEGFSTGATLFEATGHPVAIAGSAGNLLPVAIGFRAKYPGATIVIAGDADPVGTRNAEAAAAAINGIVVLPDFGEVL